MIFISDHNDARDRCISDEVPANVLPLVAWQERDLEQLHSVLGEQLEEPHFTLVAQRCAHLNLATW